MVTPVTQSGSPLVFDAIPAMKVRHYARNGLPVYTYARMYVLGQALAVSLSAFERQPAENSTIGFGVAGKGGKQLRYTLTPKQNNLTLTQGGKPPKPLPSPAPLRFSGVDEQGWYWGASLFLPAETIQQAGMKLVAGSTFAASVSKSWLAGFAEGSTYCGAFGASSPLAANCQSNPPQNWAPFLIVAY